MPRRRPAQLRTSPPISGRSDPTVPRTSAPTLRAIAELERTRLHPAAIAEALSGWARFVRSPVRDLDTYEPERCPEPGCQWRDPVVRRQALNTAMHALPTRAGRELRALVDPLDDLYLARSTPTPQTAGIRDLLGHTPPRAPVRPWPADAFTFTVDLVGVGWLRVWIGDGHGELKVLASYLTPALVDLLAALISLTAGERHARLSWELEPGECRWLMAVDPYAHAHVRVLLCPDWTLQPSTTGHPVLDTDLPLPDLVRPVVAAARDLLTGLGEEEYARRWHAGPFPTDPLLTLEQWIADQDGKMGRT